MPEDEQSRNNPAVDAAIAAYLELLERGAMPDKAAFLARHPDIANELRQFIDDYHSVKRNTAQRSDAGARTYSLHADPRPIGSVPVDEIRYFGDYELLEEIERGGMGIVFKARQTTLNRIVAVKLILAGRLASQAEVDRFYAEAKAAAQLDHRNIVPIYEVGEHRGQHYYSMAYVPGASLSLRLLVGPVPPREAATIIRDVALAVHYAHGQGVIHRDLKPANILMDADGQPRVTDFGLAKHLSDDSGLTATGQVLGTPSFMPPEQVAQGNGEVGPWSDVYSLGATLYALLVGRPPFQSASAVDTLKQVLEKPPVPVREFDASVPKDLETIVLKCLEKPPARRYESAQALADELDRFLAGKPILARPVGRVERGWRWCLRNPVVAALSGAAASLLLAVAIVSTVAYFRVNAESREKTKAIGAETKALAAETEARKSEAAAKDIEKQQRLAAERQTRIADATRLASQAREELEMHPQRSLLLAREAVLTTMNRGEPVLPVAEETLRSVAQNVGGLPLSGHIAPVRITAFTPDGRFVATASDDFTIRLWDLTKPNPSEGPKILLTGPRPNSPYHSSFESLSFSNDGRWLAAAGLLEHGLYVWDIKAGDPQATMRIAKPTTGTTKNSFLIRSAKFSPDGKWLVCRERPNFLHRLDRDPNDSKKPTFAANAFELKGFSLSMSLLDLDLCPVGRWLIASDYETWSRDGKQQAVPRLHVWDLNADDPTATARVLTPSNSEGSYHERNSYSKNGRWLLARYRHDMDDTHLRHGEEAHLWDLESDDASSTERVVAKIGNDETESLETDFSPDSRWLLIQQSSREERLSRQSDDENRSTRLLDLQSAPNSGFLKLPVESKVMRCAFNPAGRWLATEHKDHTVRLWDLSGGGPDFHSWIVGNDNAKIATLTFTPDGKGLYFGGVLLDVTQPPEKIRESGQLIDDPRSFDERLTFSPNAHWLLNFTGAPLNTHGLFPQARGWDLSNKDGQPFALLRGHEGAFLGEFSPDGRWLITRASLSWEYSGYGQASAAIAAETTSDRAQQLGIDLSPRLWNLETLYEDVTHVLAKSHQPCESIVNGGDGKWLMAGSFYGQEAILWHFSGSTSQRILLPKIERELSADLLRDSFSFSGQHWLPAARRFNVALSPNGHWAAIGGPLHKNIRLIDLTAHDPGAVVHILTGHSDAIRSLAFSPDSRTLASGSWDRTVRLWRMDQTVKSQEASVLNGNPSSVDTLAFSPDGHYLATGSKHQDVLVFNLHAKVPQATPIVLKGHKREITALAFHKDGHRLASGSADGAVRLWELPSDNPNRTVVTLPTQPEPVVTMSFSPDGSWLCANASLWDCTQPDWPQKPAFRLSDRKEGVGTIAFAPDGRLLATAARELYELRSSPRTKSDPAILLWRLEPGAQPEQPVSLHGHELGIMALTIGGDGKALYSTSTDGTVREWTLPISELLTKVRKTAGRELTKDERRIFSIADNGASSATVQRATPAVQLPVVYSDPNQISGGARADITMRWWSVTRTPPHLKLHLLKDGQSKSTVLPTPTPGMLSFRDPLQRYHEVFKFVFGDTGRPKGVIEAELAPDPETNEVKEFGLPVVHYRYAALMEGKVAIQLLDDKTTWEIDAHAPKWQPTGVIVDPNDFANDDAALKSVVDRLTADHIEASMNQKQFSVRIISPSYSKYSDPVKGVLYGGIFSTMNLDEQRHPSPFGSDANIAVELRKRPDGSAEWFITLLRCSLNGTRAKVDRREVYRLPTLTQPSLGEFPTRTEKF